MTNDNHPITPPPELVEQLRKEAPHGIRDAGVTRELHLIIAAYRAGADQELEACCALLLEQGAWPWPEEVARIRAARRPKPKSLSESALETLEKVSKDPYPCTYQDDADWDTIRRALERLQELEEEQ